jgi:hypothetical protein
MINDDIWDRPDTKSAIQKLKARVHVGHTHPAWDRLIEAKKRYPLSLERHDVRRNPSAVGQLDGVRLAYRRRMAFFLGTSDDTKLAVCLEGSNESLKPVVLKNDYVFVHEDDIRRGKATPEAIHVLVASPRRLSH